MLVYLYFYVDVNELLCIDQSTSHILHSATFFGCQNYEYMRFKLLGCCCCFDLQFKVFTYFSIICSDCCCCEYTIPYL